MHNAMITNGRSDRAGLQARVTRCLVLKGHGFRRAILASLFLSARTLARALRGGAYASL